MTRRCDYCLNDKDRTKVEPKGSIICEDCNDE